MLENPQFQFRAEAAEALGQIGTQEAEVAIFQTLHSGDDPNVLLAELQALGNMRSPNGSSRAIRF